MEKILKFFFWVAILLGVLIGAARLVAIRWWKVPSDDPFLEASITPTLRGGDWVLLWRATAPGFGALVVCPDPEDPKRVVIGRIVGEEGDNLTIDGDRIQINDKDAHSETACSEAVFQLEEPNTGSPIEQRCDVEALGGVAHMRGLLGGNQPPPKSTRTVSQGNVFLVSDNRAYPHDSRRYGAVERATCKESVFFRLVSKAGYLDVKNRLTYVR